MPFDTELTRRLGIEGTLRDPAETADAESKTDHMLFQCPSYKAACK